MNIKNVLFGGILAFVASASIAAVPPGQLTAGYDRSGNLQQTIATDALGRVYIVGSGAGGVVYGADAVNTAPTQSPVAVAGLANTSAPTCVNNQICYFSFTTGGALRVSNSGNTTVVGAAASGAAVSGNPVLVSGSDGTNARTIATTSNGSVYISGGYNDGSAAGTTGGVKIGGSDGTNFRTLSVNSAGSLLVSGAGTGSPLYIEGDVSSGASDGSTRPVKIGGVYNSTLPTFTNGQRGDAQIGSRGSLNVSIMGNNATTALTLGAPADNSAGGVGAYTWSQGALYDGSTWDNARSVDGVSGSVGIAATANIPNASANSGIAITATSAVASNQVLKASAGNLYRLAVTTGATSGYIMVFDATSAPADGAVTPKICRVAPANASIEIDHSTMPDVFSTGITAVFSSTGCYTKTASATAAFEGQYK